VKIEVDYRIDMVETAWRKLGEFAECEEKVGAINQARTSLLSEPLSCKVQRK
jgi:hypothetical protein